MNEDTPVKKKTHRGRTVKLDPVKQLNKKQRALVEALPHTKTLYEAGLIAGYGTKDNMHSLSANTSRALRSVRVQEALDYLGINPKSIIGNFQRIANVSAENVELKASDILRATENLAKIHDLYPAQRVEKTERSLRVIFYSMSLIR